MKTKAHSRQNRKLTPSPRLAAKTATIAAVLIVAMIDTSLHGQESGNLGVWLSEAQAAWLAYEESASRIQGHMSLHLTLDGSTLITSKTLVKQNGPWQAIEAAMFSSPQNQRVYAVNSTYAFELFRETDDAEWIQRAGAKRGEHETLMAQGVKLLKNTTLRLVSAPRISLLELSKKASFTITAEQTVETSSGTFLEVKFTNEHSAREKPFCPVQSGTLVLDPQAMWCLREAVFHCVYVDSPETEEWTNEFRMEGGVPIPVRAESLSTGQNTKRSVYDFSLMLVDEDDLPDEDEFLLSAWGFAEPAELARPTPIWVWFAIGGVALIVVGTLCIRYLRKRNA